MSSKYSGGIDVAVLAGFDEAHEQGRRPATPFATYEEPVFAAQSDRSHGIFRQVVVRPESPVFQVARQGLPLIKGVIDRLPERFRGDRLVLQLFQLREYPVQERRGMLLPEATSLLGLHIGRRGLHLVIEPGNAGQDVRRLSGTGRGRFVKLPPGMGPTTHLDNVLFFEEFIVASIGVGMDISLIILEIFERSLLAAIDGEVVGRKRRAGPSLHIDP